MNNFKVNDEVDIRYTLLDGTEVWIPGIITAKTSNELTVILENNPFRFQWLALNDSQLDRIRRRTVE